GAPTFRGYRGFPAAICVSVNAVIVHGIPDATPFADGDVVAVDVGVTRDGWVADCARTVVVGDGPARHGELVVAAEQALDAGLGACRPGRTVGDIGATIEASARTHGATVFPTLIGHGVGRQLHEEPQVPNVGRPGAGPTL